MIQVCEPCERISGPRDVRTFISPSFIKAVFFQTYSRYAMQIIRRQCSRLGRMAWAVGGHTVDETPLGCLLSKPDKGTRSISAEEDDHGRTEMELITYGRVQVRLDSHEVHAVIAEEDLHDLWAQDSRCER